MEHTYHAAATDPAGDAEFDLPAGDHPLEIAARRGIGPLSAAGQESWHGGSTPCVSCGQLVRRGVTQCEHCGQDLRDEMIEKMRAHAGPWYVLEHLRPFPGVSLDRIIRQIRRGLITEVSIVRGPSTDYQWRFAVETPGLCRYFGKCWHCHHTVTLGDTYCPACLSYLSFEKPAAIPATKQPEPALSGLAAPISRGPMASQSIPPAEPSPAPVHAFATLEATRLRPDSGGPPWTVRPPSGSTELDRLAEVIQSARPTPRFDEPQLLIGPIRAAWIAAGLLMLAVLGLLWITSARGRSLPQSSPPAIKTFE